MKKISLPIVFIILAAAIFFSACGPSGSNANQPPSVNNQNQTSTDQPQNFNHQAANQNISNANSSNLNITKTNTGNFVPPLDRSGERVTKKPFGIYITPQTSPIQPERFTGYHTGADFEIFPEELNSEVPVHAVCSGQLKLKETASGYGGVAVQACELDGSPITVIYGHLKLTSIAAKAGQNLKAGDQLGILGADKSSETDGERKHLHLGFHKGTAINIKGYVSAQSALADWIDPCLDVCHN